MLALGLILVGCGLPRSDGGGTAASPAGRAPTKPSPAEGHPLVTPSSALTGRVASVNANARFVVLTFPLGPLPPVDKRLNAYRNGLKVGEIKVTGPQRDNNTVADIVAGESQEGDEVRED
jgi:hypothetical protein